MYILSQMMHLDNLRHIYLRNVAYTPEWIIEKKMKNMNKIGEWIKTN